MIYDILFSEPRSGDERFAAAIRQAGNVVLPGVALPLAPRRDAAYHARLDALAWPAVKPLPAKHWDDITLPRAEFTIPADPVVKFGVINVVPDTEDGILRRVPLFHESYGAICRLWHWRRCLPASLTRKQAMWRRKACCAPERTPGLSHATARCCCNILATAMPSRSCPLPAGIRGAWRAGLSARPRRAARQNSVHRQHHRGARRSNSHTARHLTRPARPGTDLSKSGAKSGITSATIRLESAADGDRHCFSVARLAAAFPAGLSMTLLTVSGMALIYLISLGL